MSRSETRTEQFVNIFCRWSDLKPGKEPEGGFLWSGNNEESLIVVKAKREVSSEELSSALHQLAELAALQAFQPVETLLPLPYEPSFTAGQ